MSGPVAQEKLAIWSISIIGASLKKIRDDAHDAGPSLDGSQIAFTNPDADEIWMMNSDGSQAHLFFKADGDFHLYSPSFLPNAKRIMYVKFHTENGKNTIQLESRNLQGQDPVVLLENPDLLDATFNQPGRLIYSVAEPPPHERDSNLWQLTYDPATGRPNGSPSRLTDWTGFTFLNLGISLDGKNFAFLNQRDQSAVYVGELASGGDELKAPQRLTLNNNYSWATAWSPDSKNLFFYSNSNGNFDIFRQALDSHTAEALATGADEKWAPQLSPDGKWVLYMQSPRFTPNSVVKTSKLMRLPVTGGAPESVMEITGAHSGPQAAAVNTVLGYPNFRCARSGDRCVLAERKEKNIVFTAFDPVQGRKNEVLSLPFRRGGWDLSPDGSRIAFASRSYTEGTVEIIPLDGGPHQKLSSAPFFELTGVAWAADGKSFFLDSFSSRGIAIVHLGFDGHTKMLYKPSWEIYSLAPSPDGKHLAFGPTIYDSNAWTMGSFPAK